MVTALYCMVQLSSGASCLGVRKFPKSNIEGTKWDQKHLFGDAKP